MSARRRGRRGFLKKSAVAGRPGPWRGGDGERTDAGG